jgi:DNA-binding TFAR19-related protein (PDSD5 family)
LEDDLELKLITARKLAEMRKRAERAAAESAPKVVKSNKEVVLGMLVDRGDEVLETAYQYYPKETEAIVNQLAKLIKDGRVENKVSGGEFYSILRQLGMRFSLNTTIKVQEKGRLVDLAEKLRSKDETS